MPLLVRDPLSGIQYGIIYKLGGRLNDRAASEPIYCFSLYQCYRATDSVIPRLPQTGRYIPTIKLNQPRDTAISVPVCRINIRNSA